MATLYEVAQGRGNGELHDSKYMSAAEKRKVLKQWELFLKSGLERNKFTEALYNHLMQNCSFIAHFDIHGFYATYFGEGEDTVQFLSQFDDRDGIPKSVEYGYLSDWLNDENYYDINYEMVRIAGKYIPGLIATAADKQMVDDVTRAKLLLEKHGINVETEKGSDLNWKMTFGK